MLIFTQAQLDQLRILRALDFVERLRLELFTRYPTLLARLPRFVQLLMLGNGLDRAAQYDFTQAASLAQFLALQCATAADFYQHPAASAYLDDPEGSEAVRIQRLLACMPPEQWEAIHKAADIRAWFEPQQESQRPARIAARVCSTFPELVTAVPEYALEAMFKAVPTRAARHGIVPDVGVCVFAAALALYGDSLDHADGPAWARNIFFSPSSPLGAEKIVALLRLAISLDTDRLI